MKKYLLPENGNFYKANLHCHSTFSDGNLTPEELKKSYMEHGYSIIAYTDHDIMIPHTELASEDFLPLVGYEMEVDDDRSLEHRYRKTCHMCLIALEPDNLKQVCWHRSDYLFGNAPKYESQVQFYEEREDYVRRYTGEGISEMMKMGRDAGFFVTYNHPTWSKENYNDYIHYDHMNAMEICNYGCLVTGFQDYNPRVYDDMLTAGKRIYCIATDDNHNGDPERTDSFGGFTMIKADKLEYRTITKALEDGNFYASQGPEIRELWFEDGQIHIKTSPAERIEFFFGFRKAMNVSASDGALVDYACCDVPEDCGYVRVTVIDEKGRPANTNAYFADELYK